MTKKQSTETPYSMLFLTLEKLYGNYVNLKYLVPNGQF